MWVNKDIHNISKEALARKLSSVETEQIKDAIAEIKQIGLKLLTMRRRPFYSFPTIILDPCILYFVE